jgi:hypothetical protein
MAGRYGLPEARRALASQKAPLPRAKGKTNGEPKSAARRRKENAAMERREAPALFKRECGKTEYGRALRRSIPSLLRGGKGRPRNRGKGYGLPGAGQKRGR